MANTGFRQNGSGNNRPTPPLANGLNIGPPTPPSAPPPPQRSGPVKSFLKSHWGKAVVGTLAVVTLGHSQLEHPEHSPLSAHGLINWGSMIGRYAGGALELAASAATGAVSPFLKATGAVKTGTQPAPYAVLCTSAELDRKMRTGDARAKAFAAAVQPQFQSEIQRLGYKGALFYRENAHMDPKTGVPAPVFHIPDVPDGWHPGVPVMHYLEKPRPMAQEHAATPAACGSDETYRQARIPSMDVKPN